ncbi:FAD-binding protein [Ligilactobacillus equi]
MEHLIVEAGVVIGAVVKDVNTNAVSEIYAKNVILCSGGYGANQALTQKWNPWGLKTNGYNDSHRDDGSGILAALEIGAAKDEEPASIVFNRGAVPIGTNAKDFYETSLTPPDYPGYLWLAPTQC